MGPDGGIQIGLLPYIVQFFMFMGETIDTLHWMWWTLVEAQIRSVGGPTLKHALRLDILDMHLSANQSPKISSI
jgi:hypothetical protein